MTTTVKLDRLIRSVCGRSLTAVLAIKVGLKTVGVGGGGQLWEADRKERLQTGAAALKPVVEPLELKVAVAVVATSAEAGAASVVVATQVVMPPVRRAEEPPSEACP